MFIQTVLIILSALWPIGHVGATPQIHKVMTRGELLRTFQVSSANDVPVYEVVNIRSLTKREISDGEIKRIYLSAFGKKMKLNLKKNKDFEERLKKFKVLLAETTNNGLKYSDVTAQQGGSSDLGSTYHDDEKMAAILMRQADDGGIEMEGTIGNDSVIKPIPKTLYDSSYVDDEMFLDEDEQIELNKTRENFNNSHNIGGNHIVFKRKFGGLQDHSDYLNMESASLLNTSKLHQASSSRRKRAAPDTVWPEVLMVADYDTFLLHGSNSRDVKRYFVSFFNGVDLRYKLLSFPRVRISLAGMIVAKDRDATPYLERNRLRHPNHDAVDAAGALTDMGKYLYRENRLPTYDLAVVITKLDMCRRRFEGGRCNRGTAGFAYVGGACVVNKRLEKVNSVAIIEDSGGFSGVIVAAHEIGHLLGCVHDGSPPPSYLGGPGATHCPWEDGFIMSDLRHTERGFRWSSCSIEQFKHFLNGETASCLYNFPHENDLLPRVLPGTMFTLDEQCKRDRGTTACFKDARVCAQLFCFDSASGYCVSYRPAAEGSSCGDGQVCRNGKCITEIDNIIPDYSHVTQTFVNGPQSRADTKEEPQPSQRSRYRSRARQHTTTQDSVKEEDVYTTVSDEDDCQDKSEQLARGLDCKRFFQRFGTRYCGHQFVKQNCCKTYEKMCRKS
ncbi:A disintegrin and metalloproteinase with thrombospondin motifs like [Centruroides vittatus]|uniref:A disintegrin and metalloproteinase with thrombospondin motifs like n=1 Tax=Centruroides vittatus TaxID=120091 RepID=UPI00350E90B3